MTVVLVADGAAGSPVGSDPGAVRVAFQIGRRYGNAVRRNRMRRRIRSIARDAVRDGVVTVPGAYLIRVEPAADGLRYLEVKEHVELAMSLAIGKVQERSG